MSCPKCSKQAYFEYGCSTNIYDVNLEKRMFCTNCGYLAPKLRKDYEIRGGGKYYG